MNRKYKFILNGAVLALAGIIIRTVAVSFNGYVSRRIGAEGMGLFSLVMSVYGLAVTLASSGVNLAVVRMTAESVATGGGRSEVSRIMRRAVLYGLGFGCLSGLFVFFSAGFVGKVLLGDPRTVISLRAMAFGMPPIAVTSALAGYFTGVGRAYKNAVISAIEQAVKILLIIGGIVIFLPYGTKYACFALVAASALAEGSSLVTSYLMYLWDKRRLTAAIGEAKGCGIFSKICSIALPVAVGSYIRQGFTTAEHMAIPWGLKKSGADPTGALESYGVLHGMALPLVLYPSAIIGAFTGLLVPELAGLAETGRQDQVRRLSLSAVRIALVFSIGVSGALGFFGYELGVGVYGSGAAGNYIRVLAPLVPLMFFDTTVDCILKGLGEQVYTMKVNIIDAAICLVFVVLLVPRMGIMGYVVVIYVSEAVNLMLSVLRMQKITGIVLGGELLIPFLWVGAAYSAVNIMGNLLPYVFGIFVPVVWRLVIFGVIYTIFAWMWGSFGGEKGCRNKKSKKV
ncbi:MAG: oligosaccharide flippase family protein [Clostridia bacterium]|nr:oligosaccharide flippase family protein [Clostridia bacterium]